MYRKILFIGFLFFTTLANAQSFQVERNLKISKAWSVNLSEIEEKLQITSLHDNYEAPKPANNAQKAKALVNQRRKDYLSSKTKTGGYITTSEELEPSVGKNYNGKPLGGAGIPNDNTMAISNDGIVISAINTQVTIFDTDGNYLLFRTLGGIVAGQLGILDRFYDPKVTYDPVADRFILVFLEGSNSSDTRIVVGFTETNDPTQAWNFYALDGRPLGGAKWSDYPIIAHNKEDLFITVNSLRDNESWQEGFEQSFIWQVNKQTGYDGKDSLLTNFYSGIEYEGKALWSICPVQPAINFDQDNMYFLSVRPGTSSNDSVFLHEVTNTASSGLATHELTVLTSDTKYGVPPTAFQKSVGSSLQTNDTRVLSATLSGGDIHYVQTTVAPANVSSGIYHGIISNVASSPSVKAEILDSELEDFAYPSIAFAGEDASDKHSMLITFSSSGMTSFPGTSAVFHNKEDGLGSLYSPVVKVKEGDSIINTFLNDSAERWGDYTDVQRKYNEPGVVWLCGSFGDERGRNNVWIAELKVENDLISSTSFITYPNPATGEGVVTVSAVFEEEETVDVILVDMKGAVVKRLDDQWVEAGGVEFLVHTSGVSSGLYVLSILNSDQEVLYSEKVIVE